MRYLFIVFILAISLVTFSQKATVKGVVRNDKNELLEAVNISVIGLPGGTSTDKNGEYVIEVPANQNIKLGFSYLGYLNLEYELKLFVNEVRKINPYMRQTSTNIAEFVIEEEALRTSTMNRIDPKLINQIPSAGGNFEAVLFSQPGVVSNNELSSQYSVRGGNFDENLVYVNDILVYRPFLVRSGQQEGLSFINSDMVESVEFSAGGFEARYGDKMSSVLDIKYKEPTKFGGSVTASLLGGTVHIEDASKNHRFTQIHGFRYRSNQYVLNSLDTDGDYRPSFFDYQSYITFDINDKLQLDFLGNVSRNRYIFIPETRQSDFGTINQALRLSVFFAGQEVDQYETYTGAFTLNYKPNKSTKLKFITSTYRALETETFDIEGAYRLDELERDLGSQEFGDVAFNRGVGGFINHARNYLDAIVTTAEHRGWKYYDNSTLQWGFKVQHEDIWDRLSEWEYVDSAGYSVPQIPPAVWGVSAFDSLRPVPVSPRNNLNLRTNIKAENRVISNRIMGYLQYKSSFNLDTNEFEINIGGRFNYWDFNNQLLLSPRINLAWKPNFSRDFVFRASWGFYHQPPFYREMRDLFGNINQNIKAQTSIHYVLGSDYNFKAWGRPFKFISEIYYKQLKNLIPYEIDNVRLRYYAENIANGYAAGIDLKINGEFVKGVESWASLSVMQTQEDLINDQFTEYYNSDGEKIIQGFTLNNIAVDSTTFFPGFIPRPTDQRVTFGLFFQDYLPRIPSVKMNLNILFGTGLPFGPPSYDRYRDTLRIPPYRRVDIGGSYVILQPDRERKPGKAFNALETLSLGIEVFNLLQVNNTISYLWIRDVSNRQYAIPNYLTSRQINVKLTARF